MKTLKEQILELRKNNKTYNEIVSLLKCSKGTVSYHCSEHVRQYYTIRRRKNRKDFKTKIKLDAGGKCKICGYSKCLAALDFHHIDPATKIKYKRKNKSLLSIGGISDVFSQKLALEEIKKCILLCSNCHREIESGITILDLAASEGFEPSQTESKSVMLTVTSGS